MSTVKISELPLIPRLNQDTTQTLFTGVDLVTNITGKLTASILAQSLYSYNPLNVGNNAILFPNTIAQFSGSDPLFLQVNQQNFNSTGSGDYIITGDSGTNSNNYIDFGLNGSQWNNEDYTSMYANDGYLYVQGTGTNAQGNLVIGTASPNTQINFIVGGTNAGDINASLTQNSFVLLNGTNLTFTDGSSQNTSAAPFAISNIGFSLANSSYGKANAVGVFANATFTEANSVGVFANGAFSLANSVQSTVSTQGLTLLNTQNFANGAFRTANSAVQNTAGITLTNLTLTGNFVANAINTSVSLNNITSNNAIFSNNVTIVGQLIANTLQGNVFFSNVTTITTQANTIQFTSQMSGVTPTQTPGQLWYNGDVNTLMIDTDIAGDRPGIGRTIYERVYNGTGSTITGGSWVRLAGAVTANAIPYVQLADATAAANSIVLGVVKNAIANGAYGYSYLVGVVDVENTSGFANGDIIFLSATPGQASNVAPVSNTLATISLGKILYANTTGKLQVDIKPLPAYGKANGQVLLANNGITIASNTVNVNESAATMNITGTLIVSANSTANNHITNNILQYNASLNNATVTQLTSKSTAVTCNGRTGQITTSNANINKGVTVTFTVNNSYIVNAKDVVIVNIASGATVGYAVTVTNVTPGSFNVCINNADGTPSGSNAADTLVLNFAIIRVN